MGDHLSVFGPRDWAGSIGWAADSLEAHSSGLNELNYLPVADHDTGDNAATTVRAMATAAGDPVSCTSFPLLVDRLRRSAVDGASGNSGLAISQFLLAMGGVFVNLDTAGPLDMAVGIETGAERVRTAFSQPEEGSIVSVAASASEGALAACDRGEGLPDVLLAACDAGLEMLERTPQMSELLAHHGVVDAGGAALIVVIDALAAWASGEPLDLPGGENDADPSHVVGPAPARASAAPLEIELTLTFGGDVVALKSVLGEWRVLGSDVSSEGGPKEWSLGARCRLRDAGAVIEAAVSSGAVRNIRFEAVDGDGG